MTDLPADDMPPSPGRRTDVILVELGRIGAAAQAAAESSKRTETAVTGLAARVTKLEVDFATLTTRLDERAAAEAKERADRGPRTPAVSWMGLGLSALLALYVVIDHAPN